MEALVIYPENEQQLAAIKVVMKAMKVAFEQKTEIFPTQVIDEVKAAAEEVNAGKIHAYTGLKDLLNK